MQSLNDWRKQNGHWDNVRANQARHWFEEEVKLGLLAQLSKGDMVQRMTALGEKVAHGKITVSAAVGEILKTL
jgi:LAO/AO transport system kinase